ncbi:hypothetical protein JYQ62_09295 [Nostoc sp. UHCC 0702]|nr:hypothetical protein JYQ62_09295 [Nostoc sp. UHCC 0702]
MVVTPKDVQAIASSFYLKLPQGDRIHELLHLNLNKKFQVRTQTHHTALG